MANDGTQTMLAGDGHVYVGDVGRIEPTGIAASIPVGWTDLGFITEDGVRWAQTVDVQNINAWQSEDPIRVSRLRVPKKVSFDLMQWNTDNILLAFGGGTVTEPSNGNFLYTPPASSEVDERALIIEAIDGTKKYRILIRRSQNTSGLSFAFTRANPANLALTFDILAPTGGAASFIIQSNDENFVMGS